MKTVELQVKVRNEFGKKHAKNIRREKRIPAIVYGHKAKPIPIDVDYKEFDRAIHTKAGENVVLTLKIDGGKTKDQTVIIKDIQHHPVSEHIEHVDLNIISLTEKIRVSVHVAIKGEAPGVKEGGVLDVVRHEVEVECLPTEIPEKLEIDVSTLAIGQAIHVKDMTFPAGVVCTLDSGDVVVAVHAPQAEEAAAPAGEGEKVEPEVIAKGKEEAVGEEGAEGAKAAEKKAPEKQEKQAKPEK